MNPIWVSFRIKIESARTSNNLAMLSSRSVFVHQLSFSAIREIYLSRQKKGPDNDLHVKNMFALWKLEIGTTGEMDWLIDV